MEQQILQDNNNKVFVGLSCSRSATPTLEALEMDRIIFLSPRNSAATSKGYLRSPVMFTLFMEDSIKETGDAHAVMIA